MITLEYYYFLTNVVGCPYRGKVEGLGTVMTLPVTVVNNTAATRATNSQGIYLTTNYIPIIVPEPEHSYANETVRKYEAEQYIKNKISRTNSDGSIDFLDISTNKVYKLEKGGWVNVDIQGDKILVSAKDATKSFQLTSDLGFYMEQLEKAPTFISFSTKVPEVPLPHQDKQFPSGKTVSDATGLAWSATRWKVLDAKYVKGRPPVFNGIKRQQKIKQIHDAKQFLKKRNIPVKTQTSKILDETLPSFFKRAGRVLFIASIFFEAIDIFKNRAFKASHALDLVMLGVATIPYVGWVITLAYFLVDISLMVYNYKKTGEPKGVGDYLNEWVDKKGWLEDGIILDFPPVLGPPSDSRLPIVDPGRTFSF